MLYIKITPFFTVVENLLCFLHAYYIIVLYHFSYPYAGDVTINISRLHASLAHFDIMTDEFQAKVVHVGSMVDVADIIRSIGEQAHRTDMVNIRTC